MSDQPPLFGDDRTADDLGAELKAAYAEQSRLRDLYMHYATDHQRRTEEAHALARRAAWHSVTAAPRYHLLYNASEPVRALADAVGSHKCEVDREPLLVALRDIHGSIRGSEPHLDLAPLAEIRWLREYIRRAGKRLHDQYGDPNPPIYDRCRCVGCDLIHGTDLRGEADQTEAPRSTELGQRVIDAENERDDVLQRLRFAEAANEQLHKAITQLETR